MVRPAMARIVSSTKPDSLRVSVWIITCTSKSSATRRQQSMAAGVVPQSSCSLSAQAPARDHLLERARAGEALPLPEMPMFIGTASIACSMRPMCQGPGVQVVASVPCAGPVPPPSIVVRPECRASSICCGQMKWIWASKPPAVRIRPSAAITSVPGPTTMVTPGLRVGVAGLADPGDPAVAQPDVGLVDAGPVDDQRVGEDGVDGALGARGLGLAHAVADHLAAAELHLLAVGGEVALDLDDELGVGEADAVAGGRAVHVGIGGAGDPGRHRRSFGVRGACAAR